MWEVLSYSSRWKTTAFKSTLYLYMWICQQDVDRSFPKWASETLEIWGMYRHSRLAWPSFLFTKEIKPLSLSFTFMERVQTKKFNWCFTCPWKQDQNKWALCFDESGSHTIQNVNSGSYICFKRQLSRILAHFQKTTGLCLGADSWRGERERESKGCCCEE